METEKTSESKGSDIIGIACDVALSSAEVWDAAETYVLENSKIFADKCEELEKLKKHDSPKN